MQNAGFPNERIGEFVVSRDGGQFSVENTGESEQIIALVLQRDAHRANPPCIFGLALRQFRYLLNPQLGVVLLGDSTPA